MEQRSDHHELGPFASGERPLSVPTPPAPDIPPLTSFRRRVELLWLSFEPFHRAPTFRNLAWAVRSCQLSRPWTSRSRIDPKAVLILERYVPRRSHDGGSERVLQLADELQLAGYSVSFYAHHPYDAIHKTALESSGFQVISGLRWAARSAARSKIVVVCRPEMAELFGAVLASLAADVVLVFDTVDLHSVRKAREAALSGNPADVSEAQSYERV